MCNSKNMKLSNQFLLGMLFLIFFNVIFLVLIISINIILLTLSFSLDIKNYIDTRKYQEMSLYESSVKTNMYLYQDSSIYYSNLIQNLHFFNYSSYIIDKSLISSKEKHVNDTISFINKLGFMHSLYYRSKLYYNNNKDNKDNKNNKNKSEAIQNMIDGYNESNLFEYVYIVDDVYGINSNNTNNSQSIDVLLYNNNNKTHLNYNDHIEYIRKDLLNLNKKSSFSKTNLTYYSNPTVFNSDSLYTSLHKQVQKNNFKYDHSIESIINNNTYFLFISNQSIDDFITTPLSLLTQSSFEMFLINNNLNKVVNPYAYYKYNKFKDYNGYVDYNDYLKIDSSLINRTICKGDVKDDKEKQEGNVNIAICKENLNSISISNDDISNKYYILNDLIQIKTVFNNNELLLMDSLMPYTPSTPINNTETTENYTITILKDKNETKKISDFIYFFTFSEFILIIILLITIMLILIVLLSYFLLTTIRLIDTPLELINKVTQSISEEDKYHKSKQDLEQYFDTESQVLEEFFYLIDIILKMIEGVEGVEGDKEVVNEETQTQFFKNKIETESFQRELFHIRANNILFNQSKIRQELTSESYIREMMNVDLNSVLNKDYIKKIEFPSEFWKDVISNIMLREENKEKEKEKENVKKKEEEHELDQEFSNIILKFNDLSDKLLVKDSDKQQFETRVDDSFVRIDVSDEVEELFLDKSNPLFLIYRNNQL